MPAHSATRILFRRPVGYEADGSERGQTRARSPGPRAQDPRHRKFCRVMQELLSNATDPGRVEGREKEGREGAEENGR